MSPQILSGAHSEEPVEKPEEGKKANHVGPIYEVTERVVNLADSGGRRYLKFALALEFESPDKEFSKLEGVERIEKEKRFRVELAPTYPLMQDAIIGVLSSKTAAQVSSWDGKESIKTEIKDKLNSLPIGPKIAGIFITQFVVQ